MTGLGLLHIFDAVYLVALGTWIGVLLFVTFGLTPVARRVLPKEMVHAFVYEAWSRCYLWCAVCGAVALPSLVCGVLGVPELRGPWAGVQAGALLVALLLTLYAGNVALPKRRNTVAAGGEAIVSERLTSDSLATLNSLVVMIAISLIAGHAFRAAPSSQGIVERDPAADRQRMIESMKPSQKIWDEKLRQYRETGEGYGKPR